MSDGDAVYFSQKENTSQNNARRTQEIAQHQPLVSDNCHIAF